MRYILFIAILLFSSCAKKTYTLKGEKLTKRQFDKKLDKLTREYIDKNPRFVELWNGVEVVYDTTKSQ